MAAKDRLKNVKLSEIKVGERFRKDLGDIEELTASIKEKGIIQPITLDADLNLLAGGRRVTAATKAGLDSIPALIRTIEGDIDAREIELFENIHRKQFSWHEECALIAEIDKLYKAKDQDWSMRKTAKLVDQSVGGVSRKLQLAEAAEAIPELKDCKDAAEASKFLTNLEAAAIENELAKRQKAFMEQEAPQAHEGKDLDPQVAMQRGIKAALKLADNNYMIGDVFQGLSGLKDNGHVDFIECDPPYGIDLNTIKRGAGEVGSTATSYNEVERTDYPAFLKQLAEELYRVAAPQCWMIFWFGPTWHAETLAALRSAGWSVNDIPGIWCKQVGQTQQPSHNLANAYEPFFICKKGKPLIVKQGRINVFMYTPEFPKLKYHPTQRPVPLIEELLNTFLTGRCTVLVPFLGSGATLRACYNIGHRGFGFDMSSEYKNKFMLTVEEDCRKLYDTSESASDDTDDTPF